MPWNCGNHSGLRLRLQCPLRAGCRQAAKRTGGSPRLCFAPQVRAPGSALTQRLQCFLPAGCRQAAERTGGSPRLCFAPQVRAPGSALALRLQCFLPAGCRQAAERMGGSPRLCFAPQVRVLPRMVCVCSALRPRTAVRRLIGRGRRLCFREILCRLFPSPCLIPQPARSQQSAQEPLP
jgi:hypothetical protein